jgi:hypothetical protein
MEKHRGLHAGTWAVKEGQVGSQAEIGTSRYQCAGRQESVGWQGQVEERGRPAAAGRQAGGRQAGVEVEGQKEAGSRGRQAKETG